MSDTIKIPSFRLPYPADAQTITDGPLGIDLIKEKGEVEDEELLPAPVRPSPKR